MQLFSIVGGIFRARALSVLLVLLAGVLSTEHAGVAEWPGPRVLLIHDMEGLSGQSDPYSFLYGPPACFSDGMNLSLRTMGATLREPYRADEAALRHMT